MKINLLREKVFKMLCELLTAAPTKDDWDELISLVSCKNKTSEKEIKQLINRDANSLYGELFVKLTFFFIESEPSQVIKLEIDPTLKEFGLAIYNGKISLQEAGDIAGYSKASDLIPPLLGGRPMSPKNKGRIQQWLLNHQQSIAEVVTKKPTKVNPVIKPLAAILEAAGPLIDYLLSDKSTPEDRVLFRGAIVENSGRKTSVFDITNRLAALCSETTFKEQKKSGSKENHIEK